MLRASTTSRQPPEARSTNVAADRAGGHAPKSTGGDRNRRRGYVRLYRSILDSPIFLDSVLLMVWVYVLAKGNHRPRNATVRAGRGVIPVFVDEGEMIWGAGAAAEKMRIAKSTADRALKRLEKLGCVVRKPGRHFTIVTICNWRTYQNRASQGETQSGFSSETPTGTRSETHCGNTQELEQTLSNKHLEKPRRQPFRLAVWGSNAPSRSTSLSSPLNWTRPKLALP